MKAVLSAASLGLGTLFLGAQTQQSIQPIPARSFTNILGNGGIEAWNHGSGFQGPIGPDLWLAMGDTSDVFTQADVAFTRIDGCPPASDGSAAMQVRANLPQNFVSQSVESFGEYAGRDLTFSISVRTTFSLASARIAIDDGVSTSSQPITIPMGPWERVTVHHTVAACPTKLEFKIYPEQTIDVDQAMAVIGTQPNATFVPRSNPEPSLQEVPLGSVLDWFRFDASIPVPEGFAICDGSLVADAGSPYVGKATPNLADRFVRGVTNTSQIGQSGGSASASLNHSHTMTHTHSGTTNPNLFFWYVAGIPQTPFLAAQHNHTHTFTTSSISTNNTGSTVLTVPTEPPFVGLLKIIRIK